MKKRIIAIVMALAVCVSVFPSDTAYATTNSMPKEVSVMEMTACDEANSQSVFSLLGHSSTDSSGEFETGRIFVTGTGFSNYYGAVSRCESGGVSLLQYSSPAKAQEAYEKFLEAGYTVYPDQLFDASSVDAGTVSYSGDVIGQYGSSVTDSTHTVSLTTSAEIMGLSISSSNIVGAQSSTTIHSVGVAVIDSGLDTGTNFSSRFSGRVRSGYNVLSGGTNTADDYGHGTFISSIIANNTPSNVSIVPIKAVDSSGAFTASRLASALQYVVSHSDGVNLVNLSLSICTMDSSQMDQVTSFINPYIDTLYAKGILVITSAGNKSSSYPSMTADDSYPANYDKTVAVSGIADKNGVWGAYSQSLTGTCIDFTAPARFVRGIQSATMNMSKASAENNWTAEYLELGDGTCLMSGTSQATAFVSAAAAHVYSYDSNYSAASVLSILQKNASKALIGGGYGKDNSFGYGYPEMSAYCYVTGSYDPDTNGSSGVVPGFDISVDQVNGTVTLLKYTGTDSSVVVADKYTINDREYTTVLGTSTSFSGPFAGNTNIKGVTLGNNVTVKDGDGSYMFFGCSDLSAVNRIPDNTTDASYMFYGCKNLLSLPALPLSVRKMDYTFYGCSGAKGESVVNSPSVESAKEAYSGTGVSVTVPSGSNTYTVLQKELLSANGDTLLNGKKVQDTVAVTKYKVTFYYRNRTVNKSGDTYTVEVAKDSKVTKPKNPTLSGYYFKGWYTADGKKFDFNTKITSATKIYAKWTSKSVGKTSISKLKRNSDHYFTIGYKKVSGATGYEICYSRHSNFQSSGRVRTTKLSKKVHTVYTGTYYVRVRAYKKLGDKYYYGKWSTVKKVKLS